MEREKVIKAFEVLYQMNRKGLHPCHRYEKGQTFGEQAMLGKNQVRTGKFLKYVASSDVKLAVLSRYDYIKTIGRLQKVYFDGLVNFV